MLQGDILKTLLVAKLLFVLKMSVFMSNEYY